MTRNKLTSDKVLEQASLYRTASITPGRKRLVLVFIASTRPGAADNPAVPTVSGNGMTWQMVDTVTVGQLDNRRLTCFRSMSDAPTAGQIAFEFDDQTQNYCAWSIFEYDGVDTGGTSGSDAVARHQAAKGSGAGITASLGSAGAAGNLTVGAVMLELQNEAARPVSPGAGFTEIDEQGVSQIPIGKSTTLQTQDAASAVASMNWTWVGSEAAATIILDIKGAPVPGTTGPGTTGPGTATVSETEKLIRRFEPILSFHAQEMFFPVDAKRFVENAALWRAVRPFDDKNNWGGGGGFPRTPTVDSKGLVDIKSESGGKYIDDNSLRPNGTDEEYALEFGGWKDADDDHEPDVTESTANVYADRAEIARRYDTDMEPGKYWYHAEHITFERLRNLVLTSGDGNLGKTLVALGRPSMLLYYFFFPAHEQSVGGGQCNNVEARELACHAGDWQCAALLLDGDGTGPAASYQPRFYGISGLDPGGDRPRVSDDEARTVLKVEEWSPGADPALQPKTVGDHPRFYVAKGSHSLYPDSGVHAVDPYWDYAAPQQCGRIDANPLVIHNSFDEALGKDLWAFFSKIAIGVAVGSFLGGLVAGYLEADNNDDPFPGPGIDDKPNADATPSSSDGITIRPAGVAVPGLSDSNLKDWRSAKLTVGQRSYDFVVDRETQGFWPDDDGTTGFRGRWGQRVTHDFPGGYLVRRSGPMFPEYWKMFLYALESGRQSQKLQF